MSFCAFPRTRLTPLATLVSVSLLALSGCATKEFVQQEVGVVGSRIDTLQNLLNTVSQRIDGNSVRLNHTDIRLGQAEQTATTLGSRIDGNLAGLASANHRLDGLSGDLVVAGRNIAANTAEIARAHARVDATETQAQASRRRLEGTVAGLVLAENRLVVAESALKNLSQVAPTVAESSVAPAIPQPKAKAADVAPVTSVPVATLGDAGSRLDSIAALVAAANQRIAANSSAIDGVATRLAGVESGMGATLKRTEAGEQALVATNARIGEVREQLGAAQQSVTAQATVVVAVERRLDEVKGVLDVGDKNLAETSARVAQLQAGLKEESERMTRHEADAAAGSSAFKKTLTGLGTVLEGVNTRLADTDKHVVQLQTSVKDQSSRLNQNSVQVAQTVATIKEHEERMLRDETVAAAISATAKEALERAISAGRLAEGKLLYETVLSEELTNFDLEQAKLSEAGKQALTNFADKLRAENKNVFIEIQGHTDNTGSTARNLRLARERAEVVRAFLHDSGGIPLHRMAVATYGESRPLADNRTREGRMKNRRVVLVVLQ